MSKQYIQTYQGILAGSVWKNLCDRAKWKLTGADRVRWLNGQVTNDVRAIQPGEAMYAAVTNAKGKMEGDVWIHATEDAFWLDADSSLAESLRARLERYMIADDVAIEDVTREGCLYHALEKIDQHALQLEGARWIQSRRWGEPGWDIWAPAARQMTGDASAHDLEMEEKIWELLRVERGVPRWGFEMDANTLPPEVGLDKTAVSYTKGCYIGQEVLARIHSIGRVNRVLCKLEAIEAERSSGQEQGLPVLPESCFSEEKEAGRITSAAFSMYDDRDGDTASDDIGGRGSRKIIALGVIHRQYAVAGAELRSASNLWRIL